MKGKKQIRQQVTVSAYSMEVIKKSFISTLKWLEFYIDKSDYSGDWQRQIPEPIKRQDLNNQPSEIKKFMETALLALDGMINDKPDFVLKNLQEQFYSWLDKSGIRVDNCSEELVECLVNIYKVLINDGKEFVERVDREASEGIAKMTPEERREKFYKTFTLAQKLMDSAEARKKSLEGKTYKDVETKNQFSGNPDQGKEIFGQIASSGGGGTPPGSLPSDKVDKITTEIDRFGRAKKQEIVLIRRGARLNDFNQEGKLNFNNNPIYKWNSFKVLQKFEMKNTLSENRIYLDKPYLTDDEISFVIKEFADNPSVWRIEPIQGDDYLIHSSAKGDNNREIGTLIHEKNKFSNQEWAEINEVLELNKQYVIVLRKLNREIPLERGETYEALEIWKKELEKKLLINGIRENAGKWEIREETFNKSEVLIRKTAKIDINEDYDLTGELVNKPNEFYRKDFFDNKELADINSVFTAYKICEKTEQNKNNWMIATVNHNEIILNKETALINDRGKVAFNADGEYYKKEDFSDKEWKMLKDSLRGSQNQQQSLNELTISGSQKGNKGVGGIFAIIAVVSILLIASVVVIKKRLSRKVKKSR